MHDGSCRTVSRCGLLRLRRSSRSTSPRRPALRSFWGSENISRLLQVKGLLVACHLMLRDCQGIQYSGIGTCTAYCGHSDICSYVPADSCRDFAEPVFTSFRYAITSQQQQLNSNCSCNGNSHVYRVYHTVERDRRLLPKLDAASENKGACKNKAGIMTASAISF